MGVTEGIPDKISGKFLKRISRKFMGNLLRNIGIFGRFLKKILGEITRRIFGSTPGGTRKVISGGNPRGIPLGNPERFPCGAVG